MTEQWTSALSFSSFAAPRRADGTPAASDPRHDVEETALHWQSHSSRGGAAGWASLNSLEAAGVQGRGILINRVVEIHGLSGSIGEQLTLAWAAEQDAQRFQDPEIERDPGHLEEILTVQRMAVRALCEMSTHFLLGAAHSLANLVLRVTLCNSLAAEVINAPKKNRKAKGFEPGTDMPSAWPTFSSSPAVELWAQVLPEAAEASGIDGIKKLVSRLTLLQQDPRFRALDERRGMDYHRRRPQSVKHTSPRRGIWSYDKEKKLSTTRMVASAEDAQRDEVLIHQICVDALTCITEAMVDIEPLIAESLSACHLAWRLDDPRTIQGASPTARERRGLRSSKQ
ncbi:hypothetical protein ACQVDT_19580 [Streptomyces sp. RMIT01]